MNESQLTIRVASEADAESIAAIYRPYVIDSTVSFEQVPPESDEMRERILASHLWLVGEVAGKLVGYAYAGQHRARFAYRFSTETSVYLDQNVQRRGYGSALYRELLSRIKDLGYFHAFGGVTLPNDPSLALHKKMGFERIGTFPNVGYKFEQWHDVAWFHLELNAGTPTKEPGTQWTQN